jgi:hypothetical protein
MRIELEVSEKNEGTESPYWLIIDPRQAMRCDVAEIASMITGPFFSREAAENHLRNRRYAFGKNAGVWCHSGYSSAQYKYACKQARELQDQRAVPV